MLSARYNVSSGFDSGVLERNSLKPSATSGIGMAEMLSYPAGTKKDGVSSLGGCDSVASSIYGTYK